MGRVGPNLLRSAQGKIDRPGSPAAIRQRRGGSSSRPQFDESRGGIHGSCKSKQGPGGGGMPRVLQWPPVKAALQSASSCMGHHKAAWAKYMIDPCPRPHGSLVWWTAHSTDYGNGWGPGPSVRPWRLFSVACPSALHPNPPASGPFLAIPQRQDGLWRRPLGRSLVGREKPHDPSFRGVCSAVGGSGSAVDVRWCNLAPESSLTSIRQHLLAKNTSRPIVEEVLLDAK